MVQLVIILPISQKRKMMHRESMSLIQVQTPKEWKRRDLKPGPSDAKACVPTFILYLKKKGDEDWSMILPFYNGLDSILGERVLGTTPKVA